MKIRCSSLPGASSCARRWAAQNITKQVIDAGFDLRQNPPSIGSLVGTAMHSAIFTGLLLRQEGSKITPRILEEASEESLRAALDEGETIWDDTTGRLDDAIRQAKRQAVAALDWAETGAIPIALETEVQATFAEGWILSGHLDVLEMEGVIDWKSGTAIPHAIAQIGGYALATEAVYKRPITRATEVFIRRVGVTKPQPDPVVTAYPADQAKLYAYRTLQDLKSAVERFEATKSPWEFMPNPQCMTCRDRYCPAWGTKFCEVHKKG